MPTHARLFHTLSRTLLCAGLALLLAGCDLDALLADPKTLQKEADAKAVGGACRHGMRSIEDCYAMNEKASKSAIFAGWKEMDAYMRDNKIDGIEPKGLRPPAPPAPAAPPSEEAGSEKPTADEGKHGSAKAGKGNEKTAEKSHSAKH